MKNDIIMNIDNIDGTKNDGNLKKKGYIYMISIANLRYPELCSVLCRVTATSADVSRSPGDAVSAVSAPWT